MNPGWVHRNNKRACKLPDLYAPGGVELTGTPESRLAVCLDHAYEQLKIAAIRRIQRRALREEL